SARNAHQSRRRAIELAKQIVQVKRISVHLQRPIRLLRPFLFGTIPIEFDSIVIRVAQVKRLADTVVACTLQRDFGDDQPARGICEEPPGGVKNCSMVKTGAAGRRGRSAQTLPGIEPKVMMIPSCRYEGRAGPTGGERKTQHPTIKIQSS